MKVLEISELIENIILNMFIYLPFYDDEHSKRVMTFYDDEHFIQPPMDHT